MILEFKHRNATIRLRKGRYSISAEIVGKSSTAPLSIPPTLDIGEALLEARTELDRIKYLRN